MTARRFRVSGRLLERSGDQTPREMVPPAGAVLRGYPLAGQNAAYRPAWDKFPSEDLNMNQHFDVPIKARRMITPFKKIGYASRATEKQFKNARTTAGSKLVPEQRSSSFRPFLWGHALR